MNSIHHQYVCLINDGQYLTHHAITSFLHVCINILLGMDGIDKTYLQFCFQQGKIGIFVSEKTHPGHIDLFDFEHLFLSDISISQGTCRCN